jgi:hypothetical protein
VARMAEMKNAYKIIVGKPEGRSSLERSRHRLEGNIRTNVRAVVLMHVLGRHRL